ncbi:hypothetical protein TrRE_jg10483 [Triparma retinervis]|uniref:Uncharacterized protein n=1 Tax=Triparma retinervis TaxID=2557542 RepID=A0A9W7DTN3_9STRA|nr:hypothetical protein TrRE_jg10483 [Triparma retinervis]
MRYRGESLKCRDKVNSGSLFSLVFVLVAFANLCVLPFHPGEYNISHVVKFDFRFKEQVQLTFFIIASMVALFIYASAQEIQDLVEWFDPENKTVGSEFARGILYSFTAILLVVTVFSGSFADHSLQENRAHNWTGYFRAMFMTRRSTEVAPLWRYCVVFSLALLTIPSYILLGVGLSDASDDAKYKMYYIAITCQPLYSCFGACVWFSRPHSTSTRLEYAVLCYTFVTGVAGSVGSKLIGRIWAGQLGAAVFFLILGMKMFPVNRKYLNTHSDEQISNHLQATVACWAASVPPCVYLLAETYGCVSLFDELECELLFVCNYCVVTHLSAGMIFFCSCGYTFAHQDWVDILTFRNCNVSTFIRTFAIALATVLSLLVFGVRPKDSTYTFTSLEHETNTIKIIGFLRYYLGFSWFLLLAYHHYPISELYQIEVARMETGMDRVKTKKTRMSVLHDSLEAKLQHLVVAAEEKITISSAYKKMTIFMIVLPSFGTLIGIVFLRLDETYQMKAAVAAYSFASFMPASLMYSVVFLFSNLDKVTPPVTYRALNHKVIRVVLIPFFSSIVLALWRLAETGKTSPNAVLYPVLYYAFAKVIVNQRNSIVLKTSAPARRQHLYGVICSLAVSQLPPLLFMSSEYIACVFRSYEMKTGGADDTDYDLFSSVLDSR